MFYSSVYFIYLLLTSGFVIQQIIWYSYKYSYKDRVSCVESTLNYFELLIIFFMFCNIVIVFIYKCYPLTRARVFKFYFIIRERSIILVRPTITIIAIIFIALDFMHIFLSIYGLVTYS